MLKPDLFTDLSWLDRISFKLHRFSKQSTAKNVYACRCPYCGDSQKSKKLTRLYFYTKGGQLNFDCKNCGSHGSFYRFMSEQVSEYFEEYKKDQMLKRFEGSYKPRKAVDSTKPEVPTLKPTEDGLQGVLKGMEALTAFPDSHEAVKYLKSRGFERPQINRLYFSKDFKVTANDLSPEPLSEKFPNEPRIVIPFFNEDGKIEMIQGRSLDPKASLRYISIKANEDVDKIFGKYEVDKNKTSYCVEGPLDSLFVDNCYATCDSSLSRSEADVLIWDNQCRSKEIVDLMENAISSGRNIVVWPASTNNKVDINDMIQMGLSQSDLMDIIKSRTFNGVRAKLELNRWKRI